MAGLALSLLMALAARADSAENSHVAVSCEEPRVAVIVEGNQFDVLAPGYPESFAADVMVAAVNGWVLIKPKASALPLKMKGGDTSGYEVERDPEDAASGAIAFHNYHIKSDRDGGAKDIVVPAGTSVTYTAYRNGTARRSDWTISGPGITEFRTNTAFTYHCTYERFYGPTPTNHHHRAYAGGQP
ncbi:MAG: hypothetical protein GX230_03115 [Lentisphaerae bacterium]|nr:hypothetical protein [Lentisphaerota bacterium]